MSIAEFMERLDNAAEGIDEVHAVGGLHPDWDITHFVELFRTIKMKYPHIHIKALSAIEVLHLSSLSEIPTTVVLSELKKAGLGSLPGGGAEILDDSIRDIICRGKESSDEYLRIHSEAHSLGIPTNATMLFGTVEGWKERIEHLLTLRETQDKTGGFQCFIPYPFLPDNSRLPVAQLAGTQDILRVIAISRLMLDNIPHLKAYRMNLGDEVTELALGYGADDVDGTVMTEEVMTLAGSQSKPHSDIEKLVHLIENAGGNAVIRDSTYTTFKPIALYHEEE